MTPNLIARSQAPPSTSPTPPLGPKMPDRVLTNEDSAISPATGRPISQHEAAGLKGLTKQQHAKFWEEVTHWDKERFTEAKWRQVLKRIWRVKQEHCMIVLGWYPPPSPIPSIVTPEGRHLLLYSSSSLTAPTGAHPLRPAHLPRIETSSPTLPRPRWDIVFPGRATPLSTTTDSVNNAFAEGGFWASLTTPKTPVTAIPIAKTPTTATLPEPWVPDSPTDPEAKVTYEEIKHDVNKMALQLCASRYSLRRSLDSEFDVIHPSMVRPRDTLLAAQLTLASYQLPLPLSSYVDVLLPQKIEAYADEEAAGARQYGISSREKLEDVDVWLQFDETTGGLTTILEAQRDLLRMNRNRRKSRDVAVEGRAIRLAWAVKVVDDSQYFVDNVADGDSDGSEGDEGYEYGNFIRSLGLAEGDSIRSSMSTLELSFTNSSDTRGSGTDKSMEMARRSASSPIKPTEGFGHENLPLRSRNLTLSNFSHPTPSPNNHTNIGTPNSPHAHGILRSNATAMANTSSRRNQHGHLSINTSLANSSLGTSSTMSPQERDTRHKGPSIEDLNSWADELKKMERKRAEIRLEGWLGGSCTREEDRHGGRHGLKRQIRWFSVDEGGDSDGAAMQQEEREAAEGKEGSGDGLVINGSLHPALRESEEAKIHEGSVMNGREGGRAASRGSVSTASWHCETASSKERDSLPRSIDTIDNAKENEQNPIENQTCGNAVTEEEDKTSNPDLDPYSASEHDNEDEITTPTSINLPFNLPTYPLRTSSSPTHPPIKLSQLPTLRLDPPRQSPRPAPLPTPLSHFHLALPQTHPAPITVPPLAMGRYNRHAATSYERQASKPRVTAAPSVPSVPKRGGVSKVTLLQDITRPRSSEHTHSRSRSKVCVKGEEEEKWGEELRAMENRERMRQMGLER